MNDFIELTIINQKGFGDEDLYPAGEYDNNLLLNPKSIATVSVADKVPEKQTCIYVIGQQHPYYVEEDYPTVQQMIKDCLSASDDSL